MNRSSTHKKILIIGNGEYALKTAEKLASENIESVIIFSGNKEETFCYENKSVIPNARILSCQGTVGNFQVSAKIKNEKRTFEVSEIVIAEDAFRKTNFPDYGEIEPSGINPLSYALKHPDIFEEKKSIVFLTGIQEDSDPSSLREIMNLSLLIQEKKPENIYILTKNLKVAGNGLEALYRRTKEAGIIYFKFTHTTPQFIRTDNNKNRINCTDEISMQNFVINPDIIIADEKILPSENLEKIAEIFRLDSDPNGFIQTDNIHRLPIFTNRKGIFAVGTSRKPASEKEKIYDIDSVIFEISSLGGIFAEQRNKAEIDTKQCIRCLTCYRICPHKAVISLHRPEIIKNACEGCGICIGECPREAIRFAEPDKKVYRPTSKKPFISAFCCERSAGRAIETLKSAGVKLPEHLKIIEVQCAGSVSTSRIYSEFQKGADSVILLTCHQENCYSEYGNIRAKKRAEYISEFFDKTGIGKEKIGFFTTSSNMQKSLSESINKFVEKISA